MLGPQRLQALPMFARTDVAAVLMLELYRVLMQQLQAGVVLC